MASERAAGGRGPTGATGTQHREASARPDLNTGRPQFRQTSVALGLSTALPQYRPAQPSPPPTLARGRLEVRGDGRVKWSLRRPWRDGTRAFVFDPLTFLERLAALVPHPREHQWTYFGILAPASPLRDAVVPRRTVAHRTGPSPGPRRAPGAGEAEAEAEAAPCAKAQRRSSLARLAVFPRGRS